jgi:hypothetical protein
MDDEKRDKARASMPIAARATHIAPEAAGASPVDLMLRGSLAERRSNHFRERRDTQSNWVPLSSCSQMQYPFGEKTLM